MFNQKFSLTVANLLLSLLLVLPSMVQASESDTYIGLQVNVLQLNIADEDPVSAKVVDRDSQPAALSLKYGGEVNDWLAVEIQYSYGIASDEIEDTGVNVNLSSMIALSSVFKYHVTGPLNLFAKAGVARASFETRESEKAIATGLLYGAGFSLDVSETSRLLVEFSTLKDADFERSGNELEADTIGFGIQFDI